MADNSIQMPGSFGGLMRFQEEYSSRIKFTPTHVIAFVVLVVAFRVFLEFWY